MEHYTNTDWMYLLLKVIFFTFLAVVIKKTIINGLLDLRKTLIEELNKNQEVKPVKKQDKK